MLEGTKSALLWALFIMLLVISNVAWAVANELIGQ